MAWHVSLPCNNVFALSECLSQSQSVSEPADSNISCWKVISMNESDSKYHNCFVLAVACAAYLPEEPARDRIEILHHCRYSVEVQCMACDKCKV